MKPILSGSMAEKRRFILARDKAVPLWANIQSVANCAMYQDKAPSFMRVFSLKRNEGGTLTGINCSGSETPCSELPAPSMQALTTSRP